MRRALSIIRVVGIITAAVSMLAACSMVTRVDAPISFVADRRLELAEPGFGETVRLPLRVSWRVRDFPLTDGNHFAVFIDDPPVGQGKRLRWRLCTRGELVEPHATEIRDECHDDRKTVFVTSETSLVIDCIDPKLHAPDTRRHHHEVTVVLLDGESRRVGRAVARAEFQIEGADQLRCPLRPFDELVNTGG